MKTPAWLTGAVLVALVSAAVPAGARPCATMALENSRRTQALPWLAVQDRPYEPNLFVDSASYPLRVHYSAEAAAVRAGEVLDLLEQAWTAQVVGMGFSPPPSDDGRGGSDAYDVYFAGLAGAGAVTVADDDEDDADGRVSRPSHMQIDPNVNEIEAFVAHEFQHALQFGIDGRESLMFFEAGAVFQEFSAYPETIGYKQNIEDFQSVPALSIFSNGIAWAIEQGEFGLLPEYGAGLFIHYLDEVHGDGDGTFIRRLWDGSVQGDEVMANEPDWMDAFAAETGRTVPDILLDFATWRTLVGPKAVPGDGPVIADELNAEHFLRTRALAPASLNGALLAGLADDAAPYALGCFAFSTTAPAARGLDVLVDVRSIAEPPRRLGLAFVTGQGAATTRTLHDQRGPDLSLAVAVGPAEQVTFVTCDLSDADADDELVLSPIEVRVTDANRPVTDAGVPEPEPSPEPEPGVGDDMMCGCQQALPDGGPFGQAKKVLFPLMLLGGLVTLIIRGRRASRRKKSYRGGSDADQAKQKLAEG